MQLILEAGSISPMEFFEPPKEVLNSAGSLSNQHSWQIRRLRHGATLDLYLPPPPAFPEAGKIGL